MASVFEIRRAFFIAMIPIICHKRLYEDFRLNRFYHKPRSHPYYAFIKDMDSQRV